ncbi:hypothetical protein D2V93_14410 [Flagellimonas taeanensis]|nr:hypothetical protein D2V93_14410 [Allomuricauda taeanensis]
MSAISSSATNFTQRLLHIAFKRVDNFEKSVLRNANLYWIANDPNSNLDRKYGAYILNSTADLFTRKILLFY